MLSALGAYNRSLGFGRQPLKFADVLWGRLVVETSTFESPRCGLQLAPVADLVNHSSQPNVEYSCDEGTGQVELAAGRDIATGEELTAAWHKQKLRELFLQDCPSYPGPLQPTVASGELWTLCHHRILMPISFCNGSGGSCQREELSAPVVRVVMLGSSIKDEMFW